jgi:hypothetical protein
MEKVERAISIKQPWAALIIAGRKSIEIRTWPTTYRGWVLIHAGKKADTRETGWELIDTPELEIEAAKLGGIIGVAEVCGCLSYETKAAFTRDRELHRNDPDWFTPPEMFGFQFRQARSLPFKKLGGQTFFFKVEGAEVS